MQPIQTDKAPQAIGPYSQGQQVGSLVFFSGQLPAHPQTGELPAAFAEQVEQCCQNIASLLEAAGSDFEHVVKTTCFLQHMEDFQVFNEIYARYFISKPARSCVAVKSLPKQALVEIEVVAELR